MIAIVGRNINRSFAAGEEQALSLGVFADDVDVAAFSKASNDFAPRLAAISCAQNVWAKIIESQCIDGRIGHLRVGVAGFDHRNLLPWGQSFRSDVGPVRAAIDG